MGVTSKCTRKENFPAKGFGWGLDGHAERKIGWTNILMGLKVSGATAEGRCLSFEDFMFGVGGEGGGGGGWGGGAEGASVRSTGRLMVGGKGWGEGQRRWTVSILTYYKKDLLSGSLVRLMADLVWAGVAE